MSRKRILNGKLTKERRQKLNDIGFIWNAQGTSGAPSGKGSVAGGAERSNILHPLGPSLSTTLVYSFATSSLNILLHHTALVEIEHARRQ